MRNLVLIVCLIWWVVGCKSNENENIKSDDLAVIAKRTTGVFVDRASRKDSVLFYFDDYNDSTKRWFGMVSHDFSVTDNDLTIRRLHEDKLILFKRDIKIFIEFIPVLGDRSEHEVVFVNDSIMRLGTEEFQKVKAIQ